MTEPKTSKKMIMTFPQSQSSDIVKPILQIKSIQFCHMVMVNFQLVDKIDSDKFTINFVGGDLVFYTDKQTKVKYVSPLSNISSMVVENE